MELEQLTSQQEINMPDLRVLESYSLKSTFRKNKQKQKPQ